jgi:excisionase family DNA binding protein
MAETARISLPEAAERLGVHYMTVYRYVRTGQLPAVRVGAKWSVNVADLGLTHRTVDVRSERSHNQSQRAARLLDRMTAGDGAGAWTIVDGALASGSDPKDIYINLLAPVLTLIGDGWSRNEISIAQEHRASVVATQIVGRLGPRFARRGRSRGAVVLGLVPSEQHALPALMLADLIRLAGFEPLNLGANTPAHSFVETALGADRLVAILVGATNYLPDDTVSGLISEMRNDGVTSPILLGGRAITSKDHAIRLGASGWTGQDAASALEALENLVARVH